jgi:hypothetical protein
MTVSVLLLLLLLLELITCCTVLKAQPSPAGSLAG